MKKMMTLCVLFLSGCYSAKDDCYHGLYVSCNGEEYSLVAEYQKPFSLGHTDSAQRWEDISECGLRKGDLALDVTKGKPFDYDMETEILLVKKFNHCMAQKGYIQVDYCGRKNSTTDKGICNE